VQYSLLDRVSIVCGHYLGVDERILSLFEMDEISVGDYVMTGGEAAAAVMLDSITRLIPGVLGNFESALTDSHTEDLLGAPVYTRPEEFMGLKVPETLINGNHKEIKKFRRYESLRKTLENRADLLKKSDLDNEEILYIERLIEEKEK